MYAIALMINIEIFIPLLLSRNNCAFNHVYIYIVSFIGFFIILIYSYRYFFVLMGNACVPYHKYIYTVNYLVCYTVLI